MHKQRRLTSKHPCPNCETGDLLKVVTNQAHCTHADWRCDNVAQCGYVTPDNGDRPLGRFDCPRCARPLQIIRSATRTKWRCTGWFQDPECTATFDDWHGIPQQLDGNKTRQGPRRHRRARSVMGVV